MRRIASLLVVLFYVLSIVAHEVNNYKYFCIEVKEDPYGIEERFVDEFLKMGFTTIDREYYERLEESEKSLTLFAEYNYFINYNGPSSLTLTLRNTAGEQVWAATGYGNTFLSARGDMKSASKQIIRSFSGLHYKFNLVVQTIKDHPYAKWTEDSVRNYLRTKRVSEIEGLYRDYANDGFSYDVAILKHKDEYLGIIVDTDDQHWKTGEVKFVMNYVSGVAYDAEYFLTHSKKLKGIASLEDDRFFNFVAGYNGQDVKFSYLKVFPASDEQSPSGLQQGTDEGWTSNGSGVLISDNIIITNHHVVDNAKKIEVTVTVGGMPEVFAAKVLCADKTNDLAILCIKDDKFKSVGESPFKIATSNVDVGTSVFAMGYPLTNILGEEVKITDGIISSKSGYEGDVATYQISAPIQPGNSGGPLFDKDGDLIGITSSGIIKSVAEDVGYAIKSAYILSIIDSAPIGIKIPQGTDLPKGNLPELIKVLKPYVVYIKVR